MRLYFFIVLCLGFLCQCKDVATTNYQILFATTDFATLVSPIIQRQGDNLLVCKSGRLEFHNIKEQQLNWSYDLQHDLRAYLWMPKQILTAVTYLQNKQEFAILSSIEANKGQLLRKDTIPGNVEFLWAIPNSKDYLIQTTVYKAGIITSNLQRRSMETNTTHWSLSKVLLSPPSAYDPPYAYIGQANEIYVLDVDKGTLTANCSELLDTTIIFYQQQAPQSAKREWNWHQHITNTCQLEQEAWHYKTKLTSKASTILGKEGDTQLHSISPMNRKPKPWQQLQAPLKVMTPTAESYLYQLEEEGNHLYYYDPTNNRNITIPLTGKLAPKNIAGIPTFIAPYIIYFQQEEGTANYILTCQQVAIEQASSL